MRSTLPRFREIVVALLVIIIAATTLGRLALRDSLAQLPRARSNVLGATMHKDPQKRLIILHAINRDKAKNDEQLVKFMMNSYENVVEKEIPSKQPKIVVPFVADGVTYGFVIHY